MGAQTSFLTQPSQAFRALSFLEMIQRCVLTPSLVASFSHSDTDINRTIEAIGEALQVYQQALESGVENFLIGRPVKPVFRTSNGDVSPSNGAFVLIAGYQP
jgi:glutamate-1-semialdehyde 2,1-aminomutase